MNVDYYIAPETDFAEFEAGVAYLQHSGTSDVWYHVVSDFWGVEGLGAWVQEVQWEDLKEEVVQYYVEVPILQNLGGKEDQANQEMEY